MAGRRVLWRTPPPPPSARSRSHPVGRAPDARRAAAAVRGAGRALALAAGSCRRSPRRRLPSPSAHSGVSLPQPRIAGGASGSRCLRPIWLSRCLPGEEAALPLVEDTSAGKARRGGALQGRARWRSLHLPEGICPGRPSPTLPHPSDPRALLWAQGCTSRTLPPSSQRSSPPKGAHAGWLADWQEMVPALLCGSSWAREGSQVALAKAAEMLLGRWDEQWWEKAGLEVLGLGGGEAHTGWMGTGRLDTVSEFCLLLLTGQAKNSLWTEPGGGTLPSPLQELGQEAITVGVVWPGGRGRDCPGTVQLLPPSRLQIVPARYLRAICLMPAGSPFRRQS